MKYILYIQKKRGTYESKFDSLKEARKKLASYINDEQNRNSSISKNTEDDYTIHQSRYGYVRMYIKKETYQVLMSSCVFTTDLKNNKKIAHNYFTYHFNVKNWNSWIKSKIKEWRSKGYEVHYTKEVPYKLHARKKIKNSNSLFQLNIHCTNHPQSIQDYKQEYERD